MFEESVVRATKRKKRILVLCDYYLPSTKAGGGTWAIVNMTSRFRDRYDFFIITRNHESRTDTKPFPDVASGTWNDVGGVSVCYLSPNHITTKRIGSLFDQVDPDAVYLNSVFARPAVTFLRLRQARHDIKVPVVSAPCGENSQQVH